MRTITILLAVSLTLFASAALAKSYNYLSPADTKEKLVQQQAMLLVDIQVEDEFNQHHLPGALATYAFPVKSADDKAKLATALPQLKESSAPVVIVCPRGGGGAKRAYDYLEEQGIAENRLFILEKGQQGWPYSQLLAQ